MWYVPKLGAKLDQCFKIKTAEQMCRKHSGESHRLLPSLMVVDSSALKDRILIQSNKDVPAPAILDLTSSLFALAGFVTMFKELQNSTAFLQPIKKESF